MVGRTPIERTGTSNCNGPSVKDSDALVEKSVKTTISINKGETICASGKKASLVATSDDAEFESHRKENGSTTNNDPSAAEVATDKVTVENFKLAEDHKVGKIKVT